MTATGGGGRRDGNTQASSAGQVIAPAPLEEPLDGTDTPTPPDGPEVKDALAVAHTTPVIDEIQVAPPNGDVAGRGSTDAETLPAERGLRGLIGGGSSQVSPGTALRARDAARARPEDLARAEANLTIVRRNWSPRE